MIVKPEYFTFRANIQMPQILSELGQGGIKKKAGSFVINKS